MTAQCSAINAALGRQGLNSAGLASKTGLSPQRVDLILSGAQKPTQQEFDSIARVLGLTSAPQHAANVVA